MAVNEILVLSVLHNLHKDNDYYSLDILNRLLKQIAPGVICVELSPENLAAENIDEILAYRTEYNAILPYAAENGCALIALEPEQPKYDELVNAYRAQNKAIDETEAEKVEVFGLFVTQLYDQLFQDWDSVMAVNSACTDYAFKLKHNFQAALFGEKEAEFWDGWNQNFFNEIMRVNSRFSGERILVTVGAEHKYW